MQDRYLLKQILEATRDIWDDLGLAVGPKNLPRSSIAAQLRWDGNSMPPIPKKGAATPIKSRLPICGIELPLQWLGEQEARF